MDYLPEPDIFHDVFGHVPLHADPAFADFLQRDRGEKHPAPRGGRVRGSHGLSNRRNDAAVATKSPTA